MIWFTADLHLGHRGILSHQPNRAEAFNSVEEMDTAIIDGINSVLSPGDELWHLGDFCWKPGMAGHYRQRINTRRMYAIRGNHDTSSLRRHVCNMWEMHVRNFNLDGERYRIHLSHPPILSWYGMHHGSIHLYGHAHGMYEAQLDLLMPTRRSQDVGIDYYQREYGEWKPFSLATIVDRLIKDDDYVGMRRPGPFEEYRL